MSSDHNLIIDKYSYDLSSNDKVWIFNSGDSTIAGIRVNFRDLPMNEHALKNLEEVLSKRLLNFEYIIEKPNSEREESGFHSYQFQHILCKPTLSL